SAPLRRALRRSAPFRVAGPVWAVPAPRAVAPAPRPWMEPPPRPARAPTPAEPAQGHARVRWSCAPVPDCSPRYASGPADSARGHQRLGHVLVEHRGCRQGLADHVQVQLVADRLAVAGQADALAHAAGADPLFGGAVALDLQQHAGPVAVEIDPGRSRSRTLAQHPLG